jgi:tetratricopeptide (TPR) repeat protein
MSESPNKLIRFWQELKRRKVLSVVTTYAATAYIIIEVVNNLIGPLHLPDWLATLVVILLIIGLPAAVIVAWIFDLTPKGIKKTESLEESEKEEALTKSVKRKLRPSYVLNAVLIIAVIILAYPKIFKRNTLEKLRASGERISIAVMPFQNMTNDTIWNVWQDGIQQSLISSLSNTEELIVRQKESINILLQDKGLSEYATISPSFASKISRKLNTNIFIYGSINLASTTLRLNAQLINSKTEEVYKSFQIDGPNEKILQIIDSLSMMVRNSLIIYKLKKNLSIDDKYNPPTSSPEAYRYFILGQKAYNKTDYPTAVKLYSQALAIDSNFLPATIMISTAYGNQGMHDQAKKWCLRAYDRRDKLPILQNIRIKCVYANLFETPKEEINYYYQLQELDDQFPLSYYQLGRLYVNLDQYDKAISVMRKNMEIYKKWGSKPRWINDYIVLGFAYQKTCKYRKERKLFKKAEHDFPGDLQLMYRKTVLALSEDKTKEANDLIEKYVSTLKNNFISEADIASNLGDIYWDANILYKAEAYFRKALLLESDNPDRMNYLAYFLIDKDRNINEGLELIIKAIELRPDHYSYLNTKGWGLYKLGKYHEALDILQKGWDLRMKNAVYNDPAFLHLEAAKKAVANLK